MYKMMKKGMFPRIAAVMLMLTLLSTCVISGTFAKYTTTGNTSATARVAKWGVTIAAEASDSTGNAFLKEYAADEKGTGLDMSVSADTAVIAPGTSGVLGTVGVTGKPEVAVKVTFAAPKSTDVLVLTGWTVGEENTFYCPLIFKVGEDTVIDGSTYDSADALEADVAEAIVAQSTYFEAGVDLATAKVAGGVTIAWEWPISVNDTNDTALGNAATPATITLNLAVTVEQVD